MNANAEYSLGLWHLNQQSSAKARKEENLG